jgi:hypothetical protein
VWPFIKMVKGLADMDWTIVLPPAISCRLGSPSIRESAPSSEISLSGLVAGSRRCGGQVPPYIYSIRRWTDHEGDF